MASDIVSEATNVGSIPGHWGAGLTPHRLSVEQFGRMIDAGILAEDARVELLGGLIVEKMTTNEPHVFSVEAIADWLRSVLPPEWIVREEKPIVIGASSRPEPDLVVVRGPREAYRTRFPVPQDVLIMIEVADSSYDKDRGEKWRRYAAAGIPCYAILNLARRQLEVYTSPQGRDDQAVYRETTVIDDKAEWPARIDGRELGRIALRDLLP